MHVRRLPIANPCDQDLSQMPREGARLFCDKCRKNVTDLSSMTKVEARWFLIQHAGERMCVKYRANRQGELQFRPPPPMRMGLMAVAALALSACAGYADPAELDSPAEGVMCEDVSGYTIPCADQAGDAIDTVAVAEPKDGHGSTVEPAAEPQEVPFQGQTVAEPAVDPTLPDWLMPSAEPTGEGCPLPKPDPGDDEEYELAGDVEVPAHIQQRWERQTRRELRRERRAQRRIDRRG